MKSCLANTTVTGSEEERAIAGNSSWGKADITQHHRRRITHAPSPARRWKTVEVVVVLVASTAVVVVLVAMTTMIDPYIPAVFYW